MPEYRSADMIALHDTGIVLVRAGYRAHQVGGPAFPPPSVAPAPPRGRHIKFGLSEDLFTRAPARTRPGDVSANNPVGDAGHPIHALEALLDAAQVLHITIHFADPNRPPTVPFMAPQQMSYVGRYTVWWSDETG